MRGRRLGAGGDQAGTVASFTDGCAPPPVCGYGIWLVRNTPHPTPTPNPPRTPYNPSAPQAAPHPPAPPPPCLRCAATTHPSPTATQPHTHCRPLPSCAFPTRARALPQEQIQAGSPPDPLPPSTRTALPLPPPPPTPPLPPAHLGAAGGHGAQRRTVRTRAQHKHLLHPAGAGAGAGAQGKRVSLVYGNMPTCAARVSAHVREATAGARPAVSCTNTHIHTGGLQHSVAPSSPSPLRPRPHPPLT